MAYREVSGVSSGYAAGWEATPVPDVDDANDQAEWSGWSEPVGIGDVPVPCPVSGCRRELTALVERWAEGEPPHERVTEQVTVTEPCPVHPLTALTAEQRAALDRAAVEAFLLAPDPDEARDFPD